MNFKRDRIKGEKMGKENFNEGGGPWRGESGKGQFRMKSGKREHLRFVGLLGVE